MTPPRYSWKRYKVRKTADPFKLEFRRDGVVHATIYLEDGGWFGFGPTEDIYLGTDQFVAMQAAKKHVFKKFNVYGHRPPKLTEKDIPRVHDVMQRMKLPTKKEVAKELRVTERTLRVFAEKYDIKFPVHHVQVPILANGIIGELFTHAQNLGWTIRKIAKALDTSEPRVYRWRLGEIDMPAFFVQCFADMLGFQLVLVHKVPSK